MIKFPDNFYFGSATSATQCEGAYNRDGKGLNIWDLWSNTEPNRFFNGVAVPQLLSQGTKCVP